ETNWGGMARLVTIGSMRLIHIENRTQPIFEQKVHPGRIFAQRFRFLMFFALNGAVLAHPLASARLAVREQFSFSSADICQFVRF
nr:hypothetical protein [Pirellula sp.]